MKYAYALPLCLSFSLWACGGSEFTSSSGSGGHNSTGGQGNGPTGGDPGAGGQPPASSGNECASLREQFAAKLAEARICNPDASESCAADRVVKDRCGCDVLVNPKSSATADTTDLAKQIQDANCPPPAVCQTIDCAVAPSNPVVACTSNNNVFTCQWAP